MKSGLKRSSLSCHMEDTCRSGVHYVLKCLLEKRSRFYGCLFSCPDSDFQDPFHLYLCNGYFAVFLLFVTTVLYRVSLAV